MSYKRAEQILPLEIIELIQQYVDGDYIYIPRKDNARKSWGQDTQIRKELKERNESIYADYQEGLSIQLIAQKYFLSEKSIQRIVYQMKKIA